MPQGLKLLDDTPKAIEVRVRDNSATAAFIFVHGFGAHTEATWEMFPGFLKQDPRLDNWDIYALGYPSSKLRVDIPGIWAADPGIDVLALGLRTALSLPPFDRYKAIAISAHSMGGLVVQRALADDATLAGRLSHLLLFGTPSMGLLKAWFFALAKRQLSDMRVGGSFVNKLRADWTRSFGNNPKFFFVAAAGDRDEFVPPWSSIDPFPETRASVPGNHSELVKPDTSGHRSVLLVVQGLTGIRRLQPFRFLHSCSGCFRLERLPGGPCTHWKTPPCHGAHPHRTLPADAPNGSMSPRPDISYYVYFDRLRPCHDRP